MDELTGGRAVVELLKAEQVRHIFGIVGATFLDVLDALYDDRSVEYINVRHEQAAAFMADGLARVTGLPGVCLVTSGPGATNLLTGVAAAYVAHSPVVVLVGGVSREHQQKDAFQEFDLVSMFRPVTKLAVQINKPERIPELLRAALRTAMAGRRGPVFVEIPRDVLNDQVLRTALLAPAAHWGPPEDSCPRGPTNFGGVGADSGRVPSRNSFGNCGRGAVSPVANGLTKSGVTTTSNSVLDLFNWRERNNCPRIGTSPSPGILFTTSVTRLSISPAMAKLSPSRRSTSVSALRVLMAGIMKPWIVSALAKSSELTSGRTFR